MSDMQTMTRTELEAAYLASIPADLRACTAAIIDTMSDEYLKMRMAPRRKVRISRRGPKMARHCLDEGLS